nr:unnamed protein product [Callosobruchus analis]
MTEHPNYKYRPRRRKHNKQRAGGAGQPGAQGQPPGQSTGPPRVQAALPSPGGASMPSPRYGQGYVPNAAMSPTVQQQVAGGAFASIEFPSPGGSIDYTTDKRYSPDNFKFNSQFAYVDYQNFTQKSPYSIQSPETSPTQSPEPKNSKTPGSPGDSKDGLGERSSASLPTPQLSPLEHDKEAYQQYDDKRIPISIPSTMTNTSASQSYNSSRVQNYRQPNTNYTNTQPITSVPMANGMYVMCANKSSVEQGHVVTGTFYPPVATSQDQQLLGNTQNVHTIATSVASSLHYYPASIHPSYYSKEYVYETHDPSKDSFLGYQQQMKQMMDAQAGYKQTPMEEAYQEYASQDNNQLVQGYLPTSEERSDVDSDVDTREFDKYLKFGNSETNVIDSNHNYHRNESANTNVAYNFQAQHTSVILPTNVKPEPYIGHCPEGVYDLAQNGVPKNEDDFSEILAGVRKTCFST